MRTLPRPTLESSTLDVFKYVVQFLGQQGQQSKIHTRDDVFCRYRGVDDTMCAVGCLISDNQYSPDFENRSVSWLASGEMTANLYWDYVPLEVENMQKLLSKHSKMLSYLQGFHDDNNWLSKKIFKAGLISLLPNVMTPDERAEAREFINNPELIIAIPKD